MEHQWHLKRNCSLSPRQVALSYALLCLLALTIATVFAMRGYWVVLVIALLEMAGVALALLHYARHASDQEHVALSEGCLLVERVEAGRLQQVRLDPSWTRIALPDRERPLIGLESRGVKVEIGAFVSQATRQQVAREIRRELRAGSYLA